MLLVSFYTPWKHQKTRDILIFSGGIEGEQWYEIGNHLLSHQIQICGALRDLVSFVQFQKREKHPLKPGLKSVTLLKLNSSMGIFHVF